MAAYIQLSFFLKGSSGPEFYYFLKLINTLSLKKYTHALHLKLRIKRCPLYYILKQVAIELKKMCQLKTELFW